LPVMESSRFSLHLARNRELVIYVTLEALVALIVAHHAFAAVHAILHHLLEVGILDVLLPCGGPLILGHGGEALAEGEFGVVVF